MSDFWGKNLMMMIVDCCTEMIFNKSGNVVYWKSNNTVTL